MTETHPYTSSYLDRHGKRRWRFRRAGKTIQLPGAPSEPTFEATYQAALTGQPIQKTTVRRLPTAIPARSLRAAWLLLKTETIEWKQLDQTSRNTQTRIAENFLCSPVIEGEPMTFGDLPFAGFQRKHVKAILSKRSDTPHAAARLLITIRKLANVALDQEWIDYDPTYRIRFNPRTNDRKAWSQEARDAFEKRWPIGTKPRLVYALALYLGHRRSDIAKAKWDEFKDGACRMVQKKTGKALWIPIRPELAEVIKATERVGEYVLLNRYGNQYGADGLGERMVFWTAAAGLPPGHTLHGLRKTLGKMLAEEGATTRQIMAILGHDSIAHAELYTRDAEQKRLATDGMKKLAGPTLKVIQGGK